MGFSVAQICHWVQGRVANSELHAAELAKIRVDRPAPLGVSKSNELAYFFSKTYADELPTAQAGVLITGEDFVLPLSKAGLPWWKATAVVACQDPYLAMALLSEKFAERLSTVAHAPSVVAAEMAETGGKPQIHSSAVVDPTAELGAGVRIGAHVVVEAGVRIGAGSVIYPGCFIGPGCLLGENCVLFPNVTLYEWAQLGNRVRVHASTVIGSDGFGYAPRPGGHQKIHHLGRVIIGEDVEIGANCSLDRGTIADTRVERGAKIDNHVHLGHNVTVGEGAILCGGIALAGNAVIGKFAYVGGLTGVTNHVQIGDGAKVGAMSLITKDVPSGCSAVGNPQRDHKSHFRAHAWLSRASRADRNTKGSKAEK